MTGKLSSLDLAVVVAYVAVVLAAGLFMGKFVKNAKDFFSGGKKVPWWMGAVSSYMAMISCFVFIAYAQIGYEEGLVGVTVFWSTAFAILLGTFVFARRWQRANLATPVEYLERRYGPVVRQVLSWCGVAFRILDNTVRLYTLGLIASQFLDVSLATGIMLGAGLVLVYTLTGGLWSVLVTDVIQCVALMAVTFTILPLSLSAVGGLGALCEKVPEHFSLFNGHRGTFWFLAAYYLIVFIKYNGSWAFVQRLASVPNERDAVKMGLLSAAIFFVFPVLAVLPAVAARVYLPDLPPEMHERCYIEMCMRLLPSGMLGLMVSAMLAASLSTLAAEFNVTSSVFTTDIYRRLFRKNAGERETMLVARLATLGVAALIAFGALFVSRLGGAFEANKTLMALVGVPIVIPTVFGILWKRPNAKGVYACIVAGVAGGLVFKNALGLAWEFATLAQVATCLVAYWACGFLPTSARERAGRDALFAQLGRRASSLEMTTFDDLYAAAKDLPVIDWHNHLDMHMLAEDKPLGSLYEVWVRADPYKHRAMRICGEPERLITGDAPEAEKWAAWTRTLPKLVGNPLFAWAKMEMDFLGLDGRENVSLAEWTPSKILRRFNVEYCDPGYRMDASGKPDFAAMESVHARGGRVLDISVDDVAQLETCYDSLAGVAAFAVAHGWTMLLHLGALRETSARLRAAAGPAGGYAGMRAPVDPAAVAAFLDGLEGSGSLPRTVLLSLNPEAHAQLAVLAGSFVEDGVPGKVQLGPAWWWCDHAEGIRDVFEKQAAYGVLSTFIGMTTDSRSLLSFVRHDYFRRLFCRWLADKVAAGDFPDEPSLLLPLVENVCYRNARAIVGG